MLLPSVLFTAIAPPLSNAVVNPLNTESVTVTLLLYTEKARVAELVQLLWLMRVEVSMPLPLSLMSTIALCALQAVL